MFPFKLVLFVIMLGLFLSHNRYIMSSLKHFLIVEKSVFRVAQKYLFFPTSQNCT